MSDDDVVVRERIHVAGVVQGVGFRPFVYRAATELGLSGSVGNDAEGVVIDVEGPQPALDELVRRLGAHAPPRALVAGIERRRLRSSGGAVDRGFRIAPSGPDAAGGARTLVPPDVGLCDACERELFDPTDRRFRHPFITCTDCGPRFTIIEHLPYDRTNTTMAAFPMCDACAAEYDDPADRRHHAQPLCCPDCGPRLRYERSDGTTVTGDDSSLAAAVADLRDGRVVAVKGIGGYHLAVRADDEEAVRRLRDRKQRGDKPFAVMARDLDVVRRAAVVDDAEAAALAGPARPIVLLRRRGDGGASDLLAEAVAPGNPLLGVLVPYTGLHHLLLADGPEVLVLTSGNVSEEPIVFDDADARVRLLGPIADALLTHDRPIHVPCDDSVVRVLDGAEVPLRRSRGYAPLPVRLPVEVPPTLAVGGDLKAAFCLADGRDAWLSQHLGDLENLAALGALARTVESMEAFHGIAPERIVADLHPRYLGRRWAERRGAPVVAVQHHLAHVAAVMAEHGVDPGTEVTGIAMDGTGFGLDDTIWGGEALVGTYATLRRVGHLAPRPLPGGDAAVRHPARVAVALLRAAGVEPAPDLPPVAALGEHDTGLLLRQLDRGVACVASSSTGRLFDAVASLVGLCHEAGFEAQAAMALEAAADRWDGAVPEYRFLLGDDGVAAPEPVVRAVVDEVRAGVAVEAIAAGFHAAVADLILRWARRAGRPTVALSGGVFQNAVLLRGATGVLRAAGFDVLTHRVVPPNDGGLALGQVVLAAMAPDVPQAADVSRTSR